VTSPNGSIGIGVSIDASDLTTELTKAVTSAMSSVVRTVQTGMDRVDSELGSVDVSALDAISAAARDIASGIQRIDAGPMEEVTRAARDAASAADRASTAARGVGQGVDESGMEAYAQAARDAASATEKAKRSTDENTDSNEKAKRSYDDLGSSADSYAGKIAGTAAAIGGVTAAMDVAMSAIEQADMGAKLAAQLRLDPQEQAQAGKIAGDLFVQNYGASFEQVNTAVGSVLSTLGTFADDGAGQIEKITRAALVLSDTFDIDVAESTQSVNNLIRNGLVPDAVAGFDLLGRAMQNVPAAMRDELIPVIDEYAVSFAAVGMTGDEAMGAIVNAAQNGTIAMDKAGDAVKEFVIRATDIGDEGAVTALQDLGLNATDMSNKLLSGGEAAGSAFNQIIAGLEGITDPAKQAEASVAIFGTPLEDLSKNLIPQFLGNLTNGGAAIGDFSGSIDEMANTMQTAPGAALETLKRNIQQGLIDGLGKAAVFIKDNEGAMKVLAGTIGGIVIAYGALRAAAVASSIATGISTAATGANTAALNLNKVALGANAIANGVKKAAEVAGTAATYAATAAQWAFNAALSANPIGLIVVAIGAVVAALALFFTKTELGRGIWEGFVNFLSTSWEVIKAAFAAAWEFIFPILQGIWDFVGNVLVGGFNLLSSVVTTVFDAIGAVISVVWNNVVMPIFNLWKGFIEGIFIPLFMFFWNQVVEPVFTAIGNHIKMIWDTVVSVVFNAIKFGIDILAGAFNWLWTSVIQPAMNGIGAAISFVWDNVIRPAWDAMKAALDAVGGAVNWFWTSVIQPAWDGIGNIIRGVIDGVIKPAWEGMKSALRSVGDFFGTIVDGIGRVWNGLRNLLAKPINFMIGTVYNDGIAKAWNVIAGFIPGLAKAPTLPLIPEYAVGGALRGKGTGTSDDILMWGSNGEHMVTAAEVVAAGGHNVLYALRDMIARGIPFTWDGGTVQAVGKENLDRYGAAVSRAGIGNVDPQGMFDGLLPGYKDGGAIVPPWHYQLMNGHRAAKMRNGNPYTWGFEDCSGYMSMIADAIINGGDGVRRWATSSFPGGQPWVPGLGEGFSVGVHDDPGGPGGGHTAGTLTGVGPYSTTNVESGGGHGVAYGGPAVGADSSQWNGVSPGRYHLDIGANGFFQSGGGGGMVGPSPEEQKSWLEDKVHDTFTAIVDPIKGAVVGAIGSPPPEWKAIPPKFLDNGVEVATDSVMGVIGGLGSALSSVWAGAKSAAGNVLDAINPFDSGGIATGTGFMPKDIIAPERVLSPEQTRLFEALVVTLQKLAGAGAAGAVTNGTDPLTTAINAVRDAIGLQTTTVAGEVGDVTTAVNTADANAEKRSEDQIDALGQFQADVAKAVQSANDAALNGFIDVVNSVVENVLTGAVDAAFGKTEEGAYGGWLLQALAKTVGAELELRETITALASELEDFKGDTVKAFDASGRLISSTTSMLERTESSRALVDQMKEDAMKEMVRATVQFLITKILLPALSALLSALITAAFTAIGTAIAGPIGAAIGGAVGAAVGAVVMSVVGGVAGGVFDSGGVATGTGYMPKNIIAPERVLSPRQTDLFDRMVTNLESGGGSARTTSIYAPFNVSGGQSGGEQARDRLLSLLN
jgi:phage-related minor tail protein